MARRPPTDPWEIPDLELGPLPVSRPRPSREGSTNGATPKSLGAMPELELEPLSNATVGALSHSQAAHQPLMDDFDDALAIGLAGYDLASDGGTAPDSHAVREIWPHLRPIGPDHFAPSREAIEAVRPWGEPPGNLLETPSYAFWVYRGTRALLRLIDAQVREVAARDTARTEVALEWFDRHTDELAHSPRYASEYHGLEHVLTELESKSQAYSQLMENVASTEQDAEQGISETRERIRAKRAEQLSLAEGQREALCDLNRDKARRQRLDIELRTGHLDAATHDRQSAALDLATAEVQSRLDSLAREATELEQRLRVDYLGLRQEEDRLRRQQRHEQSQQQAVEGELTQVRSKATVAKLELLARLLVLRDAELFAPSVRAQWLSRESELEQAARSLACLLAAKDSFDRDKVRQGLYLVLLALALLLVPAMLGAVL